MAQLALALLGTFDATLDGQPVTGFVSAKVRALLAYLVVDGAHHHSREALAELLWPDQPPHVARDSLRQALATLRQALGDRTAVPPWLLIERNTLQFNAASDHTLDVTAFAALLTACTTHPHLHLERCAACMRHLAQAATLYRGDFLEQVTVGDSAAFEEWATLQRERLRRQLLVALAQLTTHHAARGALEQARGYAERHLELDPWCEDAHRQVMRLLAWGGQRTAALDHFARCRRILADDLGIAPAAETTTLAAQIQAGTLPAPPPATHNARLPAAVSSFLGRDTERAVLARRLADPACRLLTLTGPGGVGKTRLALQVAADLVDDFADGVAFVSLAPVPDAALENQAEHPWLPRLDRELGNIRAALRWLVDTGAAERALTLTLCLSAYWQIGSHYAEAIRWLEAALAQGESIPLVLQAHGRNQVAWQGTLAGEFDLAATQAEEAVRLFREAGDRNGLAASLVVLGETALNIGNHATANRAHEEGLQLYRELYGDAGVAYSLCFLCEVAMDEGDYDRAVAYAEESIALTRGQANQRLLIFSLDNGARALLLRGDLEPARALWTEGVTLAYASEDRRATVYYIEGFAGVAARQGRFEHAARLAGAASAVRREVHSPLSRPEAAIVERFLAPAQAQLSAAEWTTAWLEGHALTLEQAIAEALDALGNGAAPASAAPGDTEPTCNRGSGQSMTRLTAREVDVLRVVAEGVTDQEVAARLGLRRRTVTSYLTSIYAKLDVRTRTAAIQVARQQQVI